MPFCSNCGIKANEGAQFCINCGTKIGGISGGQAGQYQLPNSDAAPQQAGGYKTALIFAVVLVLVAIVFFQFFMLNQGDTASNELASSANSADTHSENWIAFTTWRSSDYIINFDENTYMYTSTSTVYGGGLGGLMRRPYAIEGNTVTLEGLFESPFGSTLTRRGGTLVCGYAAQGSGVVCWSNGAIVKRLSGTQPARR